MKIYLLLLLIPFVLLSNEDSYTLGKIIVVADPYIEKDYDKTTSEEFTRKNKNDTAQAASLIPGVTLLSAGARNEQTVNVRGLDLRQVPLLMDGIPLYLPYDGYVDLGRFLLDDISEIQVTKGYTSILVGPNAIGGVINLVGKKPIKPFQAKISLGATLDNKADYGSSQMSASLGGLRSKYYYHFFGSFSDHDHLRDGEDKKSSNTYTKDYKINTKIALTPNSTDKYSLNYIKQKGEKGVPTYDGEISSIPSRYWRYPRWDKQSLYFISKTSLSKASYLKTRLFYDELKNTLKSYDDATFTTMSNGYAFTSFYDDNAFGGNIEIGNEWEKLTLRSAFHFKRDHHQEHNEGDPLQRFTDDTFSIGIESAYQIVMNSKLVAGLSYNLRDSRKAQDYDNVVVSDFKTNKNDALNAQLNYIYKLSKSSRLSSSIAFKTRFPTMKDRYSYRLGKAIPNPDLLEERSINYEMGWDLSYDTFKFGANVFYYDIRQTIQPVTVAIDTTQMQNTGRSSIYGLEIEFIKKINLSIKVHGNYSYIHKKNHTNTAVQFMDSPGHIASLGTPITLEKWEFTPNLEYSSSRYSDSDGLQKVQGHILANFYCQYNVQRNISMNVAIQNLFNLNYQLSEGYPQNGRTYSLNGIISF